MILTARKKTMLYPSGEALAQLRHQAKISQQQLADRMNNALGGEFITQKKISRWEKSYEFEIDPELFEVLAKAVTPA
jgi:transcriptional regulator with XRE-family HTH domain